MWAALMDDDVTLSFQISTSWIFDARTRFHSFLLEHPNQPLTAAPKRYGDCIHSAALKLLHASVCVLQVRRHAAGGTPRTPSNIPIHYDVIFTVHGTTVQLSKKLDQISFCHLWCKITFPSLKEPSLISPVTHFPCSFVREPQQPVWAQPGFISKHSDSVQNTHAASQCKSKAEEFITGALNNYCNRFTLKIFELFKSGSKKEVQNIFQQA